MTQKRSFTSKNQKKKKKKLSHKDDGEPVETYLDRFPVRCQHFLGKFHHFQGHVCNRLGVTINLLVKSSCHTVGVPYCLDLCEKWKRRGKNLNAVTLNSMFVNCECRGKKHGLIALEKNIKEKSKARRQTASFWSATGKIFLTVTMTMAAYGCLSLLTMSSCFLPSLLSAHALQLL